MCIFVVSHYCLLLTWVKYYAWFGASVQTCSRYVFMLSMNRLQIRSEYTYLKTHYLHVFQVKEIYNFVQDDLTTEDVLLLDCQSEIYVWIGSNSNLKSKKQALTLGLVRFLFIWPTMCAMYYSVCSK